MNINNKASSNNVLPNSVKHEHLYHPLLSLQITAAADWASAAQTLAERGFPLHAVLLSETEEAALEMLSTMAGSAAAIPGVAAAASSLADRPCRAGKAGARTDDADGGAEMKDAPIWARDGKSVRFAWGVTDAWHHLQGPPQALLMRPDGHVAWRSGSTMEDSDPCVVLIAVLQRVLGC